MGIISLNRRSGFVTIKLKMKRTIFIFVVLLVVLGLIAWVYFDKKPKDDVVDNGNPIGSDGAQRSPDWEDAPSNITVPNVGDQVAENVAAPVVAGPAGNETDASFRGFKIRVENDKFVPDTVIVKKGDTTDIVFTAVDKNYEFFQPDYGFKVPLLRGNETTVQFQASASGKFRFYCQSCGGPESGPVGYVIVAE